MHFLLAMLLWHPNTLQRRGCVCLTVLILTIQIFYMIGRRNSGPITAHAADTAAAKKNGPTRVQTVKESYRTYNRDSNTSLKLLDDSKNKLLASVSGKPAGSQAIMDVKNHLGKEKLDNKGTLAPATKGDFTQDIFTLLVVIPSSPKGFDKRHLIRETWCKTYSNSSLVALRFVVGLANLSDEVKADLYAEERKFKDLVLLEDLLDSYKNLTRKTLYTFVWAAYNMRFLYIFKCDDDTYPHLGRMLYELHSRDSIYRLYWGFFLQNAPVRRTGKWRDKEWSLGKHYVKFAIGGGYIISSDLIDLLVNNALYLQLFTNEDVAVGLWLASFEIERRHDPRFCRFFHAQACTKDSIVALGVSNDDILYLYMDN